jgi:hypothetical protein
MRLTALKQLFSKEYAPTAQKEIKQKQLKSVLFVFKYFLHKKAANSG